MPQASAQLIDDHHSLDGVLKQLQAALRTSDVETTHAKLDLFWARLAVHIRAEHLHLFPTVLSSLETDEAQTAIAELRQDHDFFMHELAGAIEITRKLLTVVEHQILKEGLDNVKNIVVQVEQRLVQHNEVEESQIYRWASTLLNPEQQAQLAKQITTELRNHPPRFTLSAWLEG